MIDFKTVADLLSDTTLGYSGASVIVAPGDIVTAQGFRYEVAESGAVDEHVAAAGGVKLYILGFSSLAIPARPKGGIVSILEAGAHPNAHPGVNRDAIQKCMNEASEVIVPEGTFLLPRATTGSQLVTRDYTKLRGLGHRAVLKFEELLPNDTPSMILPGNFWEVEDITLDGNRGTNFTNGSQGTLIRGIDSRRGFKVRRCRLLNAVSDGVYSNLVMDPDDPFDISDIEVSDCRIENPGRQAVSFVRYDMVRILRNICINGTINFEAQLQFGDKAVNAWVEENYVYMDGDSRFPHGIFMQGGATGTPSGNWNIHRNILHGGVLLLSGSPNADSSYGFVSNNTSINSRSEGIDLTFYAHGLVLTDNKIINPAASGLRISRCNNLSVKRIYIDGAVRGINFLTPSSVPSENFFLDGAYIANCTERAIENFDYRPGQLGQNSRAQFTNVTFSANAANMRADRLGTSADVKSRVAMYGLNGDGTMPSMSVPIRKLEAQASSSATQVEGLVSDFNALLGRLRDAGYMQT